MSQAVPPPPEPEPEIHYEPCKLKSRRKEAKALGKPGSRATCFLCAYVGERDTTLPSDDVTKIIEMLRQNIGKMDGSVLAQQVAGFYASMRIRINKWVNCHCPS
jgi:hypothetical protein